LISDAELLTLAVMQALLGYTSEARWLRFAHQQVRGLFPYLPQQSGYNKRLRALAATMNWLIGVLARYSSVWSDDVWVVDSTPVECARSRETVKRSDLAGWAEYGYCAAHSRYFWGLRLHLLCTVHGLPVGFALTGAKADERAVLLDILNSVTLLPFNDRLCCLAPHLHRCPQDGSSRILRVGVERDTERQRTQCKRCDRRALDLDTARDRGCV
jgi:hypothetical protein